MEQSLSPYSIFKEQSKIIEMIALENLPLTDILYKLVQTIDLLMPSISSSILLYNEKTQQLGNGIGPKLPKGYLDDIDGLVVGEYQGSCGTAAYYKKTIIVENTKSDPLWASFSEIREKYNIIACWSKPLLSPTNKVLGTMAFYLDESRKPTMKELELIDTFSNLAGLIIYKKRVEETLYLSNAVVENSPVILMRWRAEEGWPLEYVTDNISQFGYSAEEFMAGKLNYESIIYPEDVQRVKEEVALYSSHRVDQYKQEYRILTREGFVRWIDDRTVIQRNAQGEITHFQGTVLDITDRKESESTIKFLADNDPLTQLPNRRVFMERLHTKLKEAEKKNTLVAVFFLDLDNFKDVNDLLGHYFGDQLLMNVTGMLKDYLPKQCFISRVSGDEFALILTDFTDKKVVTNTAKTLLELFHEPHLVDGVECPITASIGISLYPLHGSSPETLLKQADLAMYSAKSIGKNNYQMFSKRLVEKRIQKKQLQKELETAIKEDQFLLYYQPQLDIHTMEITGVEALIRWQHPERGVLSPYEFIPLAEETGLIFAIDDWVLRKACKQYAAWEKMGCPSFSLSINLSARQFYNKGLVNDVAKALKSAGIAPEHLTLEMTESTLMTDKDRTINVLNSLKEIGVHTSLDDFGTGYSSLSYLKFLPIDKLKLDRSFMADITTDKRDAAIVETIFTLAYHLDLDVIVEGVETKDQLDYLKGTSCTVAQGYYFSRPLHPDKIVEFFQSNIRA